VPQPWVLAKNVQLELTRSRPRPFQRAIDEPCTLPLLSPKCGTKRDFAVLPVKFNFCRKKSATKLLCVKISCGKVVATPLFYLTVHTCLKFALKVTRPFRRRWFRHISLNSALAVRASEKSSSVMTTRKSTMRFPSSHK